MRDSFNVVPKARAYVAASNAHDLMAIAPMLDDHCRYTSSGVGEHLGKAAILSMMEGFFSGNRDVHWDVPDYRLTSPLCVAFDFSISLGGQTAQGVEQLTFGEDGKICGIEVLR